MQTHTQETNRNPNPASAPGACSEVDNKIAKWHQGGDHRPLHEALGWTAQEYAQWVQTGNPPNERGQRMSAMRVRGNGLHWGGDLARLLHDAQLAVKKGKWVCRRMDEKINRLLTRIPNARGEQPSAGQERKLSPSTHSPFWNGLRALNKSAHSSVTGAAKDFPSKS